jgi:uncharacterized membrane protein
MAKIEREDIYTISRSSNLSASSVDRLLKDNVYSDKLAWYSFLKYFFISLGVGFITAGIIFFFAYNWADLHKFIKLGMIESLIISITLFTLLSKVNIVVKNTLLTGVSILVGVLFAVFGQIYQTGANAYDFFLGWTMSIAIWVIISNFPPLWIIFITLINTTFLLYSEQVTQDWSEVFVYSLIFIINGLFLIASLLIHYINKNKKPPIWFLNLLALASMFFATMAAVAGIFDEKDIAFFVLIVLIAIVYSIGIKYGLKVKSSFYLSTIPFSVIVITSAFLMKVSGEADMYFFITLFVIASVTFVIKNLINLQKKWTS